MKSLKEKIEVMAAALDGKEIECVMRKCPNCEWVESKQAWDWANYDYRIKQEPMEFWVNVYPVHNGEAYYLTDDKLAPTAESCLRTIKVREVKDES